MNTEEKTVQLVVTLNRATAEGKINWAISSPPASLVQATQDEVFLYFSAKYKGKNLGIFERRYRHYYDEFEFYWCTEAALVILDRDQRVIWEFEGKTPALTDLLATVRESVADIDSLLDDLLDGDT